VQWRKKYQITLQNHNIDGLVKSQIISSPAASGSASRPEGRAHASESREVRVAGYNRLKYLLIHPHPGPWSPPAPPEAGKPLPSREREVFGFLQFHQYFIAVKPIRSFLSLDYRQRP
jgi:hypothetical protein